MIAEATYANSVNASRRKIFRINSYEPQTCKANIAAVTGMTISGSGIRINTLIAAAMPPMSAPASIVHQRHFFTLLHSACRFHFKPLHNSIGRFS